MSSAASPAAVHRPPAGPLPAGPLTELLERVPLPSLHPHADALREEAEHWLTGTGLLDREGVERLLEQGHLELAARCWGDLPLGPALRAGTQWLLLGWILDDRFDRHWLGDASDEADRTVRELAALLGPELVPGTAPPVPATALARAFRTLWQDSIALAGPSWRARQTADFRSYLESSLDFLRLRGATPTVSQYLSHRDQDGAVRCATGTVELVHRLDLSAQFHRHPQLVDLRARLDHLIGWANDLCSYRVENAAGHGNNLLSALEVHERLPRDTAAARVTALCEAELTTLEFLAEGIARGSHWPPQVRCYVRALVRFAHAMLHWTATTARYRPQPLPPPRGRA
ncbi:terpene synthase family protein [Kitasatospora phosalacinea]|uniref:terpene synthase family protein n=1 Tax=Kitasatospora phosalacinea TaxID=2065 RepID=UPI0005254E1D|nr:terpene synthase family protein [Kitasatospora phosalacinea]